jgi:hypothetical protein
VTLEIAFLDVGNADIDVKKKNLDLDKETVAILKK